MKNSFLLSIVSVGFLLGSVGLTTAQQIQKSPSPNISSPKVVKNARSLMKFTPSSDDESTPVAPISKKEIKSAAKKGNSSTVLGGDKKITALPGVKIGHSYYDFQTNNSMPERLSYYADGAESFIQMFWMASLDSAKGNSGTAGQLDAAGFNASRGAHYAFVDLKESSSVFEWLKMGSEKVGGAPERRGWPSIVQFKDGSVGTPSHTPVDFFKNSSFDDDQFSRTVVDNTTSTWPRAAIDGEDIIHIIYNTNATTNSDPQQNFTCYRRSLDKGKTWEDEKIFTNNGFDATNGPWPQGGGGDSYAIAARGNNVVVFYGEFPNSRALYRKSTDNGVTWTTPRVAFVPEYSGVDTLLYDTDSIRIRTDSVVVCGEQFDVILDSEGNAHFVFNLALGYKVMEGRKLVIDGKDSIQIGSNLFGNADSIMFYRDADLGLAYYKEGSTTPAIHLARPSSYSWDGNGTVVSRRYGTGVSRYPQLGMDENDNLYLCFTGVKSGDTKTVSIEIPTEDNPRDGIADVDVDGLMGHIYVTHRLKGDNPNWSEPKDITPEGSDCLFGTLCNQVVNGKMYLAYSSDGTPGDRVTNTELPTEQTEIYMYPFSTSDLNSIPPVGVEEEAAANNGLALTAQPNPTNGMTTFSFAVPQSGNASVTLTNALGMNVANLYNGLLATGTVQSVNFDAQNLPSGAYYATLEINGLRITKMITIVK